MAISRRLKVECLDLEPLKRARNQRIIRDDDDPRIAFHRLSQSRITALVGMRASRACEEDTMENHRITGGGGIRLHLVETGNSRGRPILFIHGFSQCWLAWSRQLNSDLADDYRLVAMDMRGHGLSEQASRGLH